MKLYEHQQKIIADDPKIAGIFQGTGSGKTRTSLLLARGSTLVIAPKTQVEDQNWERECRKMRKNDKEHRYTMHALRVISKENFRRDHETLGVFDTVIVDEAHTCLGATPNIRWVKKKAIPRTSQLFEALETYLARTKPDRFYLVTATIIKSPMTVWAAGKLLGKKWDFYKFRNAFYVQLPMPGREVWMARNDSKTKDRLAGLVRKLGYVGRLEDFFDVPDQTHKVVYLELTASQKARIKQLKLEYPDPIVRIGKVNQVENGVLAGDQFNDAESFDNAKIDKLLDYAAEFPRMIIFAKYRAQITQIEIEMCKAGKKTFVLTGDTEDRKAVLDEAKATDEYVFIAQAQISAGWELPKCPVMIFASRTYSFVDYDQGLGRIQRSNNIKKNLYISLVVRGGVDQAVHECLENKKDFNERIYEK